MKRFSDFAENAYNLPGTKVSMYEVIGVPIIVQRFRTFPSRVNPGKICMQFQYTMDGQLCVSFTSSAVLLNQLNEYSNELPFEATIIKTGKYFTFS